MRKSRPRKRYDSRSSQTNPRLLTATDNDSSFSHFRIVAEFELCEVLSESTGIDHIAIPRLIERGSKENVGSDGAIEKPWRL